MSNTWSIEFYKHSADHLLYIHGIEWFLYYFLPMLTQHHSNMGLPKTFNRTQSKLDLDVHFILFIPFWGCWNSCSNHPLFMELWIYSLKFERAQSVKFLCPQMSPLYYILDGKAQINSSSLIIYRSQFSLAFSSSCWTKYKLKHYLPLKLPSTVATQSKIPFL